MIELVKLNNEIKRPTKISCLSQDNSIHISQESNNRTSYCPRKSSKKGYSNTKFSNNELSQFLNSNTFNSLLNISESEYNTSAISNDGLQPPQRKMSSFFDKKSETPNRNSKARVKNFLILKLSKHK